MPDAPLRVGELRLAILDGEPQEHLVRDDADLGRTGGCCEAYQKPRSHDTSRIAWAKLMTRVGEEFPLECPNCGGDIRLRWDGRREPAHFEPEVCKRKKARMASPDELPVIDIHSR